MTYPDSLPSEMVLVPRTALAGWQQAGTFPEHSGYYDTKALGYGGEPMGLIRCWWDRERHGWYASPHSPRKGMHQRRMWRANTPAAASPQAVPSEQPIAEQPQAEQPNSVYLGSAGPSEDLQTALSLPVSAPAGQEDARDAKRYRWLRDPKSAPENVIDKPTGVKLGADGVREQTWEYRAGDELDAAIDAAIAASTKEN